MIRNTAVTILAHLDIINCTLPVLHDDKSHFDRSHRLHICLRVDVLS